MYMYIVHVLYIYERIKWSESLLVNTLLLHVHCISLVSPPDDDRHDVYLTLQQGVFSKGSKRADKNVEVAVEVLGDDDNPLPFVSVYIMYMYMVSLYLEMYQSWYRRGKRFYLYVTRSLSFGHSYF